MIFPLTLNASKVPSKYLFWAAAGTAITAVMLHVSGRKRAAKLVGRWTPAFVVAGLYGKSAQPDQDRPIERRVVRNRKQRKATAAAHRR